MMLTILVLYILFLVSLVCFLSKDTKNIKNTLILSVVISIIFLFIFSCSKKSQKKKRKNDDKKNSKNSIKLQQQLSNNNDIDDDTLIKLIRKYGVISYFHSDARYKTVNINWLMENFFEPDIVDKKWYIMSKEKLSSPSKKLSWFDGLSWTVNSKAPFYIYYVPRGKDKFELQFVQHLAYNWGKEYLKTEFGDHIIDIVRSWIVFDKSSLNPEKFGIQYHSFKKEFDWNDDKIQREDNHSVVFQGLRGSETYLQTGTVEYENIAGILKLKDHMNKGHRRQSWDYFYIIRPENYIDGKMNCTGWDESGWGGKKKINYSFRTPYDKGPKNWLMFSHIGHKSMGTLKIPFTKTKLERLGGPVRLKSDIFREKVKDGDKALMGLSFDEDDSIYDPIGGRPGGITWN